MSIPVPLSIKMKRAFFNKEFDYEDPKMNDTKERERLQKEWAEKCKEISSYVRNRNKGTLETDGTIKKMLAKIIYPLTKYMFFSRYQELARSNSDDLDTLVQLADKSFIINEECNGCGTCAKVCPVKNINIEAKRPVWQHHCETCLACYHWCPNDAIEGEIVAYNKKEHHPHIKLKDMIIQ